MELEFFTGEQLEEQQVARIETEDEIKAYLQNVKYAIEQGAQFSFQEYRRIDEQRDEKYTNRFTIAKLFPDENPTNAIKQELLSLTKEEYLRTVEDKKFPNRSEFREFGKTYKVDNTDEDVYIKFRVELFNIDGAASLFVMSFHFAMKSFAEEMFPYKEKVTE